MKIVSTIALISINETVIVQMLSFLIFLFIINRLMFRPLRRVMSERDRYIQKMQDEISGAKEEVLNYTQQIEEQKEAVRAEAFGAVKEMELSGRKQADEIIFSAREEIVAEREATLKKINAQITTARKDTKKEAERLAVDIIERVLKRRLA